MILTRTNPLGLKYYLMENQNKTEIRLTGTGKMITVNIPIERLSAMWYKWQRSGEYIQTAFKELTADEREFIMTGINQVEWKELMKELEEK